MGNMILYAEAYRNMGFEWMPFNEVDSLILSQLSYYHYAKSEFGKTEFSSTIAEFLMQYGEEAVHELMTIKNDQKLSEILKRGGRHGGLRACGYVEILDAEFGDCGKQFAAITFEIEKGIYYIAYRGTDNSVTGWKEDTNLSFSREIPAQKEAVLYAQKMMDQLEGRFYLGGHSKGGNMAIYTVMKLPEKYRQRIDAVYNHDGPGFFREVYESEAYRAVRSMIYKSVPQSSLIGMIWEADDNYRVVKSSAEGFFQHDPYTWLVEDTDFVRVEAVDSFSMHITHVMNSWLEEIDFADRKRMIDAVFSVISASGVSLFNEFSEQRRQKIKALLVGITDVESDDRKLVFSAVRRLFSISAGELQEIIKEIGAAKIEKYRHILQKPEREEDKHE